MHVITGLPRSGSTLLCNILNQNPKFWATSTSILPQLVNNMVSQWSTSIEMKGELNQDRQATEDKLKKSLKAFCEEWHSRTDGRTVIFDKSRGWAHSILALRAVYPKSKVLVTVRDLRNVFASVEKQHQKTPLFDDAKTPNDKTLYNRADKLFSPNGLVGSPIVGVEDLLRRKYGVFFIKYEQLVKFPTEVMREVYDYLGEQQFVHDFSDVKNTATDPDAFYNYKFPHNGSGEVKPDNPEEWKAYISPDLANTIMQRFPFYNNSFGYK